MSESKISGFFSNFDLKKQEMEKMRNFYTDGIPFQVISESLGKDLQNVWMSTNCKQFAVRAV